MVKKILKYFFGKDKFNSGDYWEKRYKNGGNSGAGSYGELAEFKAKVINQFVQEKAIQKVIELGCGDGNQLSIANYPLYVGFDVSKSIIDSCKNKFNGDTTKFFFDSHDLIKNKYEYFDLAMSLDVLYHLVEYNVFENYMKELFNYSNGYVIIYSTNEDIPPFNNHELHRKFTKYIVEKFLNWELIETIENPYYADDLSDDSKSRAAFYFYKKKN